MADDIENGAASNPLLGTIYSLQTHDFIELSLRGRFSIPSNIPLL
jgi:hypothetical protein